MKKQEAVLRDFTTIEQSKILSEFLPIKTANMIYCYTKEGDKLLSNVPIHLTKATTNTFKYLYCWSLAALIEQIPSDIGSMTLTIEKCDSEPFKYGLNYHDRWGREDDIQTKYYDDLVDTCYEMILKLHKQKLL